MLSRKTVFNYLVFGVIAFGLIAGVYVAFYRFSIQNPGGTDFLAHWIGTRAFIFDHISPYDEQVALRTQTWVYGRPALPGENEVRVAYPFYSIFVFFPFALISDYYVARAVWMVVLLLSLGGLSIFGAKLTKWETGFFLKLLFFLFSILWYHSIRGLINGNAVILVAFLIVLSVYTLKIGRDWISGISLALATIKPQLLVLLVPLLLLWGIKNKRWSFVLWFFCALGSMVVFSTILLPNWVAQNFREVINYPAYNPPGTLGAVLATWWPGFGKQLGWFFSILLSGILLVTWHQALGKKFDNFLFGICLTLTISQWIGIQTDPGNFIVLFLPLVYLFSKWTEQGKKMWPPFAMVSLFLGLWWLFLYTIDYGIQPEQDPIMFIPLPLFLLIGLLFQFPYRKSPDLSRTNNSMKIGKD